MPDRTNSPISDPQPYVPPSEDSDDYMMDKQERASDFAKLGRSGKWREVSVYLDAKISFYQNQLPDGTPIATVPDADMLNAWKNATVIIAEFTELKQKIMADATYGPTV